MLPLAFPLLFDCFSLFFSSKYTQNFIKNDYPKHDSSIRWPGWNQIVEKIAKPASTITRDMAYSIRGHISYILEASSKRPNDFSLMESKPNEILQFK